MKTPILFMVFNRPEQTKRVFDEIAKAKPTQLLIVADGPRADHAGEFERCEAVRGIVERVDWKCEVLRNYSDVNLGCGRRESSGLIWGFEQVEELIMLEDDTLPHPSFFPFCEELLEKYRDDERIMHIAGNRLDQQRRDYESSYHFSLYSHPWGYATWRRAFRHYDFEIKSWANLRKTSWLAEILGDETSTEWWQSCFDKVFLGDRSVYDSYDAQWVYAIWRQQALSVTPSVNLVTNIGWGAAATHTRSTDHPLSNLPMEEMKFPLRHPLNFAPDRERDLAAFELACQSNTRGNSMRDRIRQSLPGPLRKVGKHVLQWARAHGS